MNESDLRVVKTREAIRSAFLELLAEKPVRRITVTELTRRARIAKGTFYLHYRDVYDLHEQLVSQAFEETFVDIERVSTIFHDAERFVNDYQDAVDHIGPEIALIIRTIHRQQYQRQLTDMLVERVYEEGEVERSLENDVRLFTLFSAFLSVMAVYQATAREAVARAVGDMAAALFPDAAKE